MKVTFTRTGERRYRVSVEGPDVVPSFVRSMQRLARSGPWFVLLALLAVRATPLTAQAASQTPALQPPAAVPVGARVRVWAPAPERRDGWLVGTAVNVDGHGVDVRDERSGVTWNFLFGGTRIEVSRGMETRAYGAVAGAIGGFLVGEALGFLVVRPAGGESADPGTRVFERLRSPQVLVIGATGGVLGFILGRRLRGERWEPVALPTEARRP